MADNPDQQNFWKKKLLLIVYIFKNGCEVMFGHKHYNEDLHGLKLYAVVSFLYQYRVWLSVQNDLMKNRWDIQQIPER